MLISLGGHSIAVPPDVRDTSIFRISKFNPPKKEGVILLCNPYKDHFNFGSLELPPPQKKIILQPKDYFDFVLGKVPT